MATALDHPDTSTPDPAGESSARFGLVVALWVVLTLTLNGASWLVGVPEFRLEEAVDEGSARVEMKGIGEVGDEVIHKAIRTQRSTLPFWTTLALLGDFIVEPIGLAVRAVAVATLFASFAALTGRPIGFGAALSACAWAQGFWVLGLAVRAGLIVALRRPEAETSLALLLPPGPCPAAVLVASRQVDAFALLGWWSLAIGGWRRGQVNLATAFAVCGTFWLLESVLRIALALTVGAGMRLTVLPA